MVKATATTEQKQKMAAYMREHRKKNPRSYQNVELKKSHGITVDQYEAMERDQGGKCAICARASGSVGTGNVSQGRLAVDHCHESGTIRGLLCTNCNLGLGSFFDKPDLLRAAAQYIEDKNTLAERLLSELLSELD